MFGVPIPDIWEAPIFEFLAVFAQSRLRFVLSPWPTSRKETVSWLMSPPLLKDCINSADYLPAAGLAPSKPSMFWWEWTTDLVLPSAVELRLE